MVKELYQIHTREITLNITNGEVESVRKKNIVKSGCRVYEDGCIGVAGTLGEPTEATWENAKDALSLKIHHPGPAKDLVRSRTTGEMPEEREFIAWTENILAVLKKEFPRYILSNKVKARENTVALRNDAGLDLRETLATVEADLVVKDEQSANVFDTFISFQGETLDTETILDSARQILSAHSNPIPMPEGDLPVVMPAFMLMGALAQAVKGTNLHNGASLFSGKLGQKLFADNFNLSINRDRENWEEFFDAEGTVLPGDHLALIENGVLVRGTADHQCAEEFGVELTASAAAAYDDVPQLGGGAMDIRPTGKREEILGGQDAILILTASGGDTTPAGDFATPVQTAYLMQNGRLTARLPEFNFGGSIFDLLGSGYLGCPEEKWQGPRWLAVKGNIR